VRTYDRTVGAHQLEVLMDWSIHHVNINSLDVRQCAAFYRDIVGISEGVFERSAPEKRGYVSPGSNNIVLIGEQNRGIHIVKPNVEFAKNNGFAHNPTIGGHFAITVTDLAAVRKRLDTAGIVYSYGGEYAMAGVINLYVYDPSMNMVEINQLV
jgi:catechol 2,3-dioxygenase-like lactoylglutathione lyase family enzyme